MAGDSKGPMGHPCHVSERTIAITGGDAGYFDLIKDCIGSLRATAEGRALALGILEKKPVPPAVFVKHQLITPKNVDLVYPLDRCAS